MRGFPGALPIKKPTLVAMNTVKLPAEYTVRIEELVSSSHSYFCTSDCGTAIEIEAFRFSVLRLCPKTSSMSSL